jgi:hypothetical protein
MTMREWTIVPLVLILGACASGGRDRAVAGQRPAPVAAPAPAGAFRTPQVQQEQGLESIIGARSDTLSRRFGTPRIDLAEGDARKLQFVSETCVLDIFLYPLDQGAEPVATHVEVRRRADAGPADRAECIRRIERQR